MPATPIKNIVPGTENRRTALNPLQILPNSCIFVGLASLKRWACRTAERACYNITLSLSSAIFPIPVHVRRIAQADLSPAVQSLRHRHGVWLECRQRHPFAFTGTGP